MPKRGYKQTEEHRRKISVAMTGKRVSPATEFKKDYTPWNKGLTKEMDPRIALMGWNKGFTKETHSSVKKQSKAMVGKIPWSKGLTKETDIRMMKISETLMGHPVSEETRIKMSGSNSPHWRGGISFEPYGLEFNNMLKRSIRERDGQCMYPGCGTLDNLAVHHVDYDKRNNDPKNLITLCIAHNSKVNFNRDYWEKHFTTSSSLNP